MTTATEPVRGTGPRLPAYPFWSLVIIAVGVVALYGLCAYGSRANLTA
jgi:hypothetical protein